MPFARNPNASARLREARMRPVAAALIRAGLMPWLGRCAWRMAMGGLFVTYR